MVHLFSDIRNMGWQMLYLDSVLIAPPRKNTSDHASHTRHEPRSKERGIITHWGSRVGVSAGRCGVSVAIWKMHALNEFAYFEYIQTLVYEDE
jgi:hypothetical protein